MLQRLADRVGYRGASLVLLGTVWFAIGMRLLTHNDPDPEHQLPVEYLNIWIRALIWIIPAILGVLFAFWPPGRTKWGFIALVIPAALRGASYTIAWAAGLVDGVAHQLGGHLAWLHTVGWIGGWVDMLVYMGVTGYVLLLSGWDEPIDSSKAEPSLTLPPLPGDSARWTP